MPDTASAQAFRKLVSSRFRFRLFALRNLPLALLAGLRIRSFTADQAVVTVPLTYLTKNPFRSVYFACLAMAAELSTGLLAMMGVYQAEPAVSMLLVKIEGNFTKKAVGLVSFTCANGLEIAAAIGQAKATGAGTTVTAASIGTDQAGDQVAEFRITWAFKVRSAKKEQTGT
jgi:acyl-coenzyme A thioesterase PaaI-like protein